MPGTKTRFIVSKALPAVPVSVLCLFQHNTTRIFISDLNFFHSFRKQKSEHLLKQKPLYPKQSYTKVVSEKGIKDKIGNQKIIHT